jgi:hypothetical protein
MPPCIQHAFADQALLKPYEWMRWHENKTNTQAMENATFLIKLQKSYSYLAANTTIQAVRQEGIDFCFKFETQM